MAKVPREMLHGYLDDSLSDEDAAKVESALRGSEALRRLLQAIIEERDRGEHSLGAIWRRQRLSCPNRDILGSYLLQALDEALQDYIDFHLRTIACPYCLANLEDLKSLQVEEAPKKHARHRRFFESSAGYLKVCRNTK
jgi:Putative zinc-finger